MFDKVRVGIEAYFEFANSEGGIEGRELELKSLDDQYLPERTRANVETLVNTDGVFALLGMVGTENNLQAQQFLAEQGLCVPNLSVATGFPGFGDPDEGPVDHQRPAQLRARVDRVRRLPEGERARRQGRDPLPERLLR